MPYNKVKMSIRDSIHDGLDKVGTGAARVGRGAVAGFIGGAIAAFVMNRYQDIETRPVAVREEELRRRERGEAVPAPIHTQNGANELRVQVAKRVSRKLFDHELSHLEQKAVSPLIHYGCGAVAGAVYGGLAELIPSVANGFGVPYATALWLGGNEIALPALGLAERPSQTPPATQASALATHFVYGISLDISRRILRRLLS